MLAKNSSSNVLLLPFIYLYNINLYNQRLILDRMSEIIENPELLALLSSSVERTFNQTEMLKRFIGE